MKTIALLGSTGSIGTNVLRFACLYPERFQVTALAAGTNIALLARQVEQFLPDLVSVADPSHVDALRARICTDWHGEIVSGASGAAAVARHDRADLVVSAMVGSAGLVPTMAAIEAGKDVALANKETLVAAGSLVMERVRAKRVRLFPIDSEHSAVAQALDAGRKEDVSRIILTASGGPFLHKDAESFSGIAPDDALAHPNWLMGKKISVDSATLMNKGLEVIEARWLFGVATDTIAVLVHPQSIVHSMVEFVDGSVVAQLGVPDMMTPISYALSWPERRATGLGFLDLAKAGPLTFHEVEHGKFPALGLAYAACREEGIMPAVMNAANEVAVDAFLTKKIRFTDIVPTVAASMASMDNRPATDLATILETDRMARRTAATIIAKK